MYLSVLLFRFCFVVIKDPKWIITKTSIINTPTASRFYNECIKTEIELFLGTYTTLKSFPPVY